MAIPTNSFHARSISLPSTSHPLNANIENHFRRLRASQAGPSSSSSICQNLCSIMELYDQMKDMIHLPHNQQILSHVLHQGDVEEVLEGSLYLLDVSSLALDALSLMKESIQNLQSALRRGSNDEGIHAFLMSRKKICKTVSKFLADMRKAEKHCPENDAITVRMLKQAEAISFTMLKSVLSYVVGKNAVSQTRGWSVVAKLVKSKHVSCEEEHASELVEMDRALRSLFEKQSGTETMVLLKKLETLEMTINEIKDGVESVSKCLVRTRVSLLNVLNH